MGALGNLWFTKLCVCVCVCVCVYVSELTFHELGVENTSTQGKHSVTIEPVTMEKELGLTFLDQRAHTHTHTHTHTQTHTHAYAHTLAKL